MIEIAQFVTAVLNPEWLQVALLVAVLMRLDDHSKRIDRLEDKFLVNKG